MKADRVLASIIPQTDERTMGMELKTMILHDNVAVFIVFPMLKNSENTLGWDLVDHGCSTGYTASPAASWQLLRQRGCMHSFPPAWCNTISKNLVIGKFAAVLYVPLSRIPWIIIPENL